MKKQRGGNGSFTGYYTGETGSLLRNVLQTAGKQTQANIRTASPWFPTQSVFKRGKKSSQDKRGRHHDPVISVFTFALHLIFKKKKKKKNSR